MYQAPSQLENLITEVSESIRSISPIQIDNKPSPSKWSKKEILGHLIDSAINNLQRFTEIQFEEKPYQIRGYNQDMLVKANAYQSADPNELLTVWVALNNRIKEVLTLQAEASLNYSIILPDGEAKDLRFLIDDYIEHMLHHLKQIKD